MKAMNRKIYFAYSFIIASTFSLYCGNRLSKSAITACVVGGSFYYGHKVGEKYGERKQIYELKDAIYTNSNCIEKIRGLERELHHNMTVFQAAKTDLLIVTANTQNLIGMNALLKNGAYISNPMVFEIAIRNNSIESLFKK